MEKQIALVVVVSFPGLMVRSLSFHGLIFKPYQKQDRLAQQHMGVHLSIFNMVSYLISISKIQGDIFA
jgi:hypothetical protein